MGGLESGRSWVVVEEWEESWYARGDDAGNGRRRLNVWLAFLASCRRGDGLKVGRNRLGMAGTGSSVCEIRLDRFLSRS